MSARKIGHSWWVDFRHAHQRIRKRSPDNSRAGAAVFEATLRGRLARGEPLFPAVHRPQPKPRFEVFAWHWYDVYVKTNNKPSEQRTKRIVLRRHLVPCFGKSALDAITALHIEQFKASQLKSGLAPKTVNNSLAILGKCLRTAEEWGEVVRMPKIKPLQVPPQKFDFLSVEEANRLIRAGNDPQWRAMVVVALRTGLRLGELLALDWTDIDLEASRLTVRRSVFGNQFVSPKSNRIRHIPLTDQTLRVLCAIKQPAGLVFKRRGPGPLNRKTPARVISLLCTAAGIRQIGWHVLRHTFASHLAMGGVSMKAIQELLGHSDIRTTMRYAHLTPSILQDAVRVLESEPTPADTLVGQPAGNAFVAAVEDKQKHPSIRGVSAEFVGSGGGIRNAGHDV